MLFLTVIITAMDNNTAIDTVRITSNDGNSGMVGVDEGEVVVEGIIAGMIELGLGIAKGFGDASIGSKVTAPHVCVVFVVINCLVNNGYIGRSPPIINSSYIWRYQSINISDLT